MYIHTDRYWLGPIWGAPTYFLIDALKGAGFGNFADRIRNKFMLLAQKGGMAENYNPITGNGLSDLAYTWTSGIYLLLNESLL